MIMMSKNGLLGSLKMRSNTEESDVYDVDKIFPDDDVDSQFTNVVDGKNNNQCDC